MKKLAFSEGEGSLFALLYEVLLSRPAQGTLELRSLNRLLDAMESVSSAPDYEGDISYLLKSKKGASVVASYVINREMNAGPVEMELTAQDVSFLKKQVEQVGWNPLAAREAAKLVDLIEAL